MGGADEDRRGKGRDEDDGRDLNREITTSHASAVVRHELHPNQPLDTGEIVHDDMRAIAAHALMRIGRDPAVGEWLARPRSLTSRFVAFVLGGVLVVGLYLGFGLIGVFGAGYLLGPLVAPGASYLLARRLFQWVHRVRVPTPEPDGLSVLNCFTAALALTVGVIFTATGSWLAQGGIALAIPSIVVMLTLVVTPLYYSVVKDDHLDSDAS